MGGARLLILPLLAVLLALTGCADRETWRQKMVVVVETPEGVVTGESVVAIEYLDWRRIALPDGAWREWRPKGEAVVVDLGKRGYLFVLLKGVEGYMGDAGPNASFAFTSMYRFTAGSQEAMAAISDFPLDKKVEISRIAYPQLVTFRDLLDPSTIKHVDPDNLAASFGRGVRLRSLTLEKTLEPVTDWGIERLLPCIEGPKQCVPVNRNVPLGHPMHNILISSFRRGG